MQHILKYIGINTQSGGNGVKEAKQYKIWMKKMDKLGLMDQEGRIYKKSYNGDVEEVAKYEMEDKVDLFFISKKLQWKHGESGAGEMWLYTRQNIIE